MTTITILKDNEIDLFDFPPRFTEEERKRFFVFPENEIKFRKPETIIGYILQEGYFMSGKKFFLTQQYHAEDVEYVKKLVGINRTINFYHKDAYSFYRQIILNKIGYRSFSDSKDLFEKEASELVKTSLRPREIFDALLDWLYEKRIEIPKYYIFAEAITKSLNLFETNLISIIDQTLTVHQKEILDQFMNLPVDSDLPPSTKNPYLITYLKNVEQSVAPGKIKQSLEDFSQIKYLHDQLSDFFKSDLISNELINYYAIWVLKAEHVQFDSIEEIERKRLYATSFITYQYKIRQDYFVDTFLQAVQKYYNDTEKSAIQAFLQEDMKFKEQEQANKIRKLMSESSDKLKLNEIQKILFSKTENNDEKVKLLMDIFNKAATNRDDAILKELDELENTGLKSLKKQLFHEELEKGHRKLSKRVSGILLILEFNPQNSNSEIYKAIGHYQQNSSKKNTGKPPLDFLGTHGYSETVFGISYLLDVQFTPRIKNYQEQLLYTFKDNSRKHYDNQAYKILPAKSAYINEKIIIEQWDQILRLLCTIKLKESLPSNILKRLSSYSKQNPLYKAIKEVGRIYKTIFLLKYYDEVLLRQSIEKQLNRVELSHHFAKTVFFGNNQELKYATKEEQEIAFGCRHLIQNAITLWNYLFISEKLSRITNQAELQKHIDLLKNSSMMSWQHVNMFGKYEFDIDVNTAPFDLDAAKSLNIK